MPKPIYLVNASVVTRYLPEQSHPKLQCFAFAYTITVCNKGSKAAKLLSRHWVITDGDSHVEEVRGAGVLGLQPLIEPGGQHVYSSGSVITTEVGTIHGSYLMHAEDGHEFKVIVAPFRLAVPGAVH